VPRRSRRRARRAQRARAGKAREKVCAIGKERAREGIRERRGREREGVIGFTGLAECAVAGDPLLASPPDAGDPSPCADASYADAGDPPPLPARTPENRLPACFSPGSSPTETPPCADTGRRRPLPAACFSPLFLHRQRSPLFFADREQKRSICSSSPAFLLSSPLLFTYDGLNSDDRRSI
jgi:hypothetical protein